MGYNIPLSTINGNLWAITYHYRQTEEDIDTIVESPATIINTKSDLYQTIRGYEIDYHPFSNMKNLHMMRDILSLRASCINNGISSDRCYMHNIIKAMPNTSWPGKIERFLEFLTEEAKLEMLDNFEKQTKTKFDPSIYYNETYPGHDWVVKWLHQWVDVLTTSDLRKDPNISYLATNYN